MDNMDDLRQSMENIRENQAKIGLLVERFDVAIEKLTEVSSNISQLLVVQANRLDFQEKNSEKMEDMFEKRRIETEESIDKIHTRIDSVRKDIEGEVDKTEKSIVEKIEKVESNLSKKLQDHHDDHSKKIGRLEKWMWILIGGIAFASFIIKEIPWSSIF